VQVEVYELTNGAEGHTVRDAGLPVIIVTNVGNASANESRADLGLKTVSGSHAFEGFGEGCRAATTSTASVFVCPEN
jgi:hypothetical protein